MMSRAWLAGALLALCTWGSGSVCGRVARQHPLTLDDDVFVFHQAIKGKDFRRAATFISPRFQAKFEEAWRPTVRGADFFEIEVIQTRRSEDADYAHVEARLLYTVTGALNQREYMVLTLWKGEGTGWKMDSMLEAPPEFRGAAGPVVPVPDAPANSASPDTTFGGP